MTGKQGETSLGCQTIENESISKVDAFNVIKKSAKKREIELDSILEKFSKFEDESPAVDYEEYEEEEEYDDFEEDAKENRKPHGSQKKTYKNFKLQLKSTSTSTPLPCFQNQRKTRASKQFEPEPIEEAIRRIEPLSIPDTQEQPASIPDTQEAVVNKQPVDYLKTMFMKTPSRPVETVITQTQTICYTTEHKTTETRQTEVIETRQCTQIVEVKRREKQDFLKTKFDCLVKRQHEVDQEKVERLKVAITGERLVELKNRIEARKKGVGLKDPLKSFCMGLMVKRN